MGVDAYLWYMFCCIINEKKNEGIIYYGDKEKFPTNSSSVGWLTSIRRGKYVLPWLGTFRTPTPNSWTIAYLWVELRHNGYQRNLRSGIVGGRMANVGHQIRPLQTSPNYLTSGSMDEDKRRHWFFRYASKWRLMRLPQVRYLQFTITTYIKVRWK